MCRSFALREPLVTLALLLQQHHQLRPAPSQPQIELEAQVPLHPGGGVRLLLDPGEEPDSGA